MPKKSKINFLPVIRGWFFVCYFAYNNDTLYTKRHTLYFIVYVNIFVSYNNFIY